MDAFIADAPNNGPFLELENHDPSVRVCGRRLNNQPDILEQLRIPESLKVPAQRLFVVRVAGPAKYSRLQGIFPDAPISHKIDPLNHGGSLSACVCGKDGSTDIQQNGVSDHVPKPVHLPVYLKQEHAPLVA